MTSHVRPHRPLLWMVSGFLRISGPAACPPACHSRPVARSLCLGRTGLPGAPSRAGPFAGSCLRHRPPSRWRRPHPHVGRQSRYQPHPLQLSPHLSPQGWKSPDGRDLVSHSCTGSHMYQLATKSTGHRGISDGVGGAQLGPHAP